MKERFFGKIKNKLRSDSGFSLVESMICMLIVGIVSISMVTGVQCGINAYQKVVDEANGRVLLSTAMTMLRNEFSTATLLDSAAGAGGTGGTGGTSIRYKTANGIVSEIQVCDVPKSGGATLTVMNISRIMEDGVTKSYVVTYSDGTMKGFSGEPPADLKAGASVSEPSGMTVAKISRGGGAADYLVQPTTATGTLQITFENVKQDPADDKVLVFENLYVYKPDSNDSENVVATIDTFCVRTQ